MKISKRSKMICGILLILVPTIMYGGITLLGILTSGTAGIAPGELSLSESQWALWRAGHAHAGVLLILSLILQPLVDAIELSTIGEWTARLGAPAASILMSGGFFGLAFIPAFQWLIYVGAGCLLASVLVAGIGLIKDGYKSDI
jgi:hypothetical protein